MNTTLTQADFQPEAENMFYDWVALMREADHLYCESDDQDEIDYAMQAEQEAWNELQQYRIEN